MGAPVKKGDNPRRAAFLQRMGRKPTPLLKSLRDWGASSKADAVAKGKAISKRNAAKKRNTRKA